MTLTKVFVQNVATGKTFGLELEARTDTLQTLRAKIKEREGVSLQGQRLFFRGWLSLPVGSATDSRNNQPLATLLPSLFGTDLLPDDIFKLVSTEGVHNSSGPYFRQWIRRVSPEPEAILHFGGPTVAVGVQFYAPERATADVGRHGVRGEVDLDTINDRNFRVFVGRYAEENLLHPVVSTQLVQLSGKLVRDVPARAVWLIFPSGSVPGGSWLTAQIVRGTTNSEATITNPGVRFHQLPSTHPDAYQGFLDGFAWSFQTPASANSRVVYGAPLTAQPPERSSLEMDPVLARLINSAVELGFERERVYSCLATRPTTSLQVLLSNLKEQLSHHKQLQTGATARWNPLHCSPIDPEVLSRQERKLAAFAVAERERETENTTTYGEATRYNRTATQQATPQPQLVSTATATATVTSTSSSSATSSGSQDALCFLCCAAPRNSALIPCGHRYCFEDATKLQQLRGRCAVCNQSITSILRTFE